MKNRVFIFLIGLGVTISPIINHARGDEAAYEKILFSNDKSARNYFSDKYGWDPKNITTEDLVTYREEYCKGFRFYEDLLKEKKDSKMKEFCSKYLGIDNTSRQRKITSAIKKEGSDQNESEIIDICMEAKDFQGCMNTFLPNNKFNIETSEDEDELDFLGLPKLNEKEWFPVEDKIKRSINYVSHAKKVKVRGVYGRYISVSNVYRFYQEPSAGTSSRVVSTGSSSVNCSTIGSTISCSSSGPTITTIPGTPAKPGGVKQSVSEVIIDCLDNTRQIIEEGKLKSGWKKNREGSLLMQVRQLNCGKILSLDKSEVKIYEKGDPNEKDRQALLDLPRMNFD